MTYKGYVRLGAGCRGEVIIFSKFGCDERREGLVCKVRSALDRGGGRGRGAEWRRRSGGVTTWVSHLGAIERKGWRAKSSADRRVGRSRGAE